MVVDKQTFLDIVSKFDREEFRRYLYENAHKRKVLYPIKFLDTKGNLIPPKIPDLMK